MAECIAQCLNPEHEIRHAASKLCILGLEPLTDSLTIHSNRLLIAKRAHALTYKLQALHILSPV